MSPPPLLIGATYLRLIGKLVVFVLIELFALGVTAEALRTNIDWKSAFLERVGQFGQIFT